MHRFTSLKRGLLLLVTGLSVLISSAAVAEGSVWRISNEHGAMFLGGTLHLLSEQDYPLPDSYQRAYEQSTRLVLETDLAVIESEVFQQQLMMRMVYPEGDSLQSHLSHEVYQQLEVYCQQQGYPMTLIRTFKPGLVSVTLSVLVMQKMGMAGTGVDQFYYRKALIDDKSIGQLETVDEQLTAMASMGQGKEDEMILNTLRDIRSLPAILNAVKVAWREGDNHQLQEIALDPMRNDYPEIYRQLLVDRNNAWLGKLDQLMSTQETELVLVGALHLVGPDGLIAQLQARGYSVERF